MSTFALVLLFSACAGEEFQSAREVNFGETWHDELGNSQQLQSNRLLKESNLLQPLTLLLLASTPTTAFNPSNLGVRPIRRHRVHSSAPVRHVVPATSTGREELSPRWISRSSAPTAKHARHSASIRMKEATDDPKTAAKLEVMNRQLNPNFNWTVRIDFSRPGTVAPVSITATLRFVELPGMAPPQGLVRVDACEPEGALVLGEMPDRWIVSEDPEEQEAGLNVLILFTAKPLLPFMFFNLQLAEPVKLGNETIPAGRIFFQVDHRRYYDGVQLGKGGVTTKTMQTYNADFVGLAKATIAEDVPSGTITFLDTIDYVESGLLPRAETKNWWFGLR